MVYIGNSFNSHNHKGKNRYITLLDGLLNTDTFFGYTSGSSTSLNFKELLIVGNGLS